MLGGEDGGHRASHRVPCDRGALDSECIERSDQLVGPQRPAVSEVVAALAPPEPEKVDGDRSMTPRERPEHELLEVMCAAAESVHQKKRRTVAGFDDMDTPVANIDEPTGHPGWERAPVIGLAQRNPDDDQYRDEYRHCAENQGCPRKAPHRPAPILGGPTPAVSRAGRNAPAPVVRAAPRPASGAAVC